MLPVSFRETLVIGGINVLLLLLLFLNVLGKIRHCLKPYMEIVSELSAFHTKFDKVLSFH